ARGLLTMNDTALHLSSGDILEVVRKFESCEFRPQEFHHRDHLTVIAHYLERMPVRQALAHMREELKKFTAYHKANGYNETITRLWIAKVAQIMVSEGGELPFAEMIERIHAALGSKELLFQYYSRERVMSEEAKEKWIEADLSQL